MHRSILLALAALVACAGCGSSGHRSAAKPAASPARADRPWTPPVIEHSNFVGRVDNPWFPLTPGTTLLYRGVMKDGTTPQLDSFAVTRSKRVVMGVPCTVVRDTVSSRGRPVERTFDWFAQD